MKNFTLILAVSAVFTACGSSQEEMKPNHGKLDIPAKVQEACSKQFPNITDIDWEQEGTNYEASFENNKIETSVVIDPNGKILETETEIASADLPKGVVSYLETNFKGKKMKEVAKIVAADGTIKFEVEINKDDLIFNSDGEYLETKSDKEE